MSNLCSLSTLHRAQPTHTGITRAIVSFVINLLQPESLTRDDHIDDDAMASKGNKEQKWEKLDDETLVTATATTVTDATEQQQSIFNKLKSFLMFGKSKNKNADSSVVSSLLNPPLFPS